MFILFLKVLFSSAINIVDKKLFLSSILFTCVF